MAAMILRRRSTKPLGRSLLVGLLVVGYFVGTLGIPLPRSVADTAHACGQTICGCHHAPGALDNCCCSRPAKPACCDHHQPPRTDKGWVIGFSVRHCQGKGSDELNVVAEVTPPPAVTWSYCWQPDGWLLADDAASTIVPAVPPLPPPRCAAV